MDQSFDMGMWLGFGAVAIPAGALIASIVVFRRQPVIIDGRLIDAARRKAFDRIADFKCADAIDEELEDQFFGMAIDCAIEAYRVFNPESKAKDDRLRKRFWAKVIVIGNAAILRIYFGKHFAQLEAQNIPIDRELRLKRPADVAPNGNGIKTKPAPRPKPAPQTKNAPAMKQGRQS